jgi:hypothetical protein
MNGLLCLVLLALTTPPQAVPAVPPRPPPEPAAPEPLLPDAEPIGFHALAEKASVRLGEPFAYSVEVRHRPEESYALHGQPVLTPFVAAGVRCRREVVKGEARTTCTMQLSLFALGANDVPDVLFDVARPEGRARLAVPGPRITGVGVIDPRTPPATLRLRDVAPPVPLLVATYRLLWWALGIGLGAVAAVIGVRALRRARERRRVVIEPTPFQRLERRIAAIEAERLPEQGLGDEHVARLSEAIREYLGALSGFPALDLTSAEILAALRPSPPPGVELDALEGFLREADLVKFARRPAVPEVCRDELAYAKSLLEATRPVVQEVTP